jgi:hypothetical protein
MTYAIIRGKNGRRHEVDFGDSPVRVEVYASEATVEIFVEADFESLPEERRRFALINVPRQQFSQATGEAARRALRDILLSILPSRLKPALSSSPKCRNCMTPNPVSLGFIDRDLAILGVMY